MDLREILQTRSLAPGSQSAELSAQGGQQRWHRHHQDQIPESKAEGAACLAGGKALEGAGFFVEPTVFDNVTDDMAIATDEIFGPVMSVLTFRDIDEVIRRGNNTFYGLAAAVWTRDVAKAHSSAAGLKAGTVWINCFDVFDAAAPFGGYKMSGIGRELGEHALEHYTELKTVTMNLA